MNKKGFTLIELLLSIVLISAITAFSVPVFSSLVTSSELNDSTDKVVHAMRRAQLLAESLGEDSSWGVFMEDGLVTVFSGSDYLSRDVLLDEVYDFSEEVLITGDDEFVFSKRTGIPTSTGTVTLTNNFGTEDISVTDLGVINF